MLADDVLVRLWTRLWKQLLDMSLLPQSVAWIVQPLQHMARSAYEVLALLAPLDVAYMYLRRRTEPLLKVSLASCLALLVGAESAM